MCGIVGCIGAKPALPMLYAGLKDLMYRGYDSAGIATFNNDSIVRARVQGAPLKLKHKLKHLPQDATVGIAHNRWATHGKPAERNAHPHTSSGNMVAVVHNGIIENHDELRDELIAQGCRFQSETDTEVIPNLIEREIVAGARDLTQAVERIVPRLKGGFAIAVISSLFQDEVVLVRSGMPLIIGAGIGGVYFASDETPLVDYVKEVVQMVDGEIATLCRDGTFQIARKRLPKNSDRRRPLRVQKGTTGKDGHKYYMFKEIMEQPESVRNAIRGRLFDGTVVLPELDLIEDKIRNASCVTLVACGTSKYAGAVARLAFEKLARVKTMLEEASEYHTREALVQDGELVIGISQSGETADTCLALEYAKNRNATCIAVVNRQGFKLGDIADAEIGALAGPEIAVASTKAFTAQVVVLILLAMRVATIRGTLTDYDRLRLVESLENLPEAVEEVLKYANVMRNVAKSYLAAPRTLFIGRGYCVPIADEGTLKLQEIGYVDAAAYSAGALKHGPLALVEDVIPVIAIALSGTASDKTLNSVQEVVARSGHIIGIVTKGSAEEELMRKLAKVLISLPNTAEELSPILAAPLVQLYAYYSGVLRKHNVDRPRNLAKSVTVE